MAINNQPRSFQQWPSTISPAPVSVTPPDFNLDAGLYGLTLRAGVWGTAALQKLLPDGVTYVNIVAPFAADGYTTLQLPACQYRMLLTGVTALNGVIELISRGPIR